MIFKLLNGVCVIQDVGILSSAEGSGGSSADDPYYWNVQFIYNRLYVQRKRALIPVTYPQSQQEYSYSLRKKRLNKLNLHSTIVSDLPFSITPVDEKPKRIAGRPRGSGKYAPILDAFLESEHKLVKVENTGKEAIYLSAVLKRLCKERGLDLVTVSVRNKEVYLEKE